MSEPHGQLITLIKQHRLPDSMLAEIANKVPHNYADLVELAIKSEWSREVARLQQWLLVGMRDEAALKAAFLTLCAEREARNFGTRLSFFAMPSGACNSLYWGIARYLFPDANFPELLAMLTPSIKHTLVLEVADTIEVGQQCATITVSSQPGLASLDSLPADQSSLHKVVVAGDSIIDLTQLQRYRLAAHQQLQRALEQHHPRMADAFYQHNENLRNLQTDMQALATGGTSVRAALVELKTILTRSGQRYTGNELADQSAEYAQLRFKAFLEACPTSCEREP